MRKLSLKRETLVELSAEDLDAVVGGAVSGTSCPACSGIECLTDRCQTRDCVATVLC